MRSPVGDQRALLPRTRKRFLLPSAFMIQSDDLAAVGLLVDPAAGVDDLRRRRARSADRTPSRTRDTGRASAGRRPVRPRIPAVTQAERHQANASSSSSWRRRFYSRSGARARPRSRPCRVRSGLTNLTNSSNSWHRRLMVLNLYEAKTQLSSLVDAAAAGAEIIIAKNGRPRASLVPLRDDHAPAAGTRQGQDLDRRRLRRAASAGGDRRIPAASPSEAAARHPRHPLVAAGRSPAQQGRAPGDRHCGRGVGERCLGLGGRDQVGARPAPDRRALQGADGRGRLHRAAADARRTPSARRRCRHITPIRSIARSWRRRASSARRS